MISASSNGRMWLVTTGAPVTTEHRAWDVDLRRRSGESSCNIFFYSCKILTKMFVLKCIFRGCSDIRITPHPLLQSNLTNFVETDFRLKDADADADDLSGIDFLDLASPYDSNEKLREKKELLRKKTLLLQKAVLRLKELIFQSSQGDGNPDNELPENRLQLLEDMRAEESRGKHFSQYADAHLDPRPGVIENPWWDRIISNRHRRK